MLTENYQINTITHYLKLNHNMESQKGLDYILVLDFEAQCLEGKKLEC